MEQNPFRFCQYLWRWKVLKIHENAILKVLTKQEGPNVNWNADIMIVFFFKSLTWLFSSSTLFLEGSLLNSSLLLHKGSNFSRNIIWSASQQTFCFPFFVRALAFLSLEPEKGWFFKWDCWLWITVYRRMPESKKTLWNSSMW